MSPIAPADAAPVIRARSLTKRFGRTLALDHLDLDVPRGSVFGYLGPNGAGKTTTIRLLVGLLRPSSGAAQVLGLDASDARDAIHDRVGYLPGDFVAYPRWTVAEYLDFVAALRRAVDDDEIEALAKRLDLDLNRKIGTLSHGNRQKVGLVQAFMGRPELLILDEPTSGLDPLMQREFLAMVREVRDEGRTVFLSSHLLNEVEAVTDTVAMLRAGRLLVVESVAALKARARRRIDLTFAGAPPLDELRRVTCVREATAVDHTVHLAVDGTMEELFGVAAPYGIEKAVAHEADLEEIFLAYYGEP